MATKRSTSKAGIFVLGLASLDLGLEQGIVVPALPALSAHYQASITGVSWLVTGFVLASIVAIPLGGRLGDLYGRRSVLLASLGAFAGGSLVCALTDSIELAVAGRVLQGCGAAAAPLALGLVRDNFPREHVTRGIGFVVGATAAGGSVGLITSGFIVDRFSAAAIFWFLFALPLVLIAATLAFVRESERQADVSIDLAGAVTLGAGLVSLLLAISKGSAWGWDSAATVTLFVISALALGLFLVVESRARLPLVDVQLLRTSPFLSAHVCAFAFGYSGLIAVLLIPLLAGAPTAAAYGLGLSTIEIGLILVPTGIGGFAAGWLAGRAIGKVGPRLVVAIGSLFAASAYVLLAFEHDSTAGFAVASMLLGISWGLILTGIYSVVIGAASADKTSVAVAVNVVVRNTAVAIGGQAAVAIVTGAGLVGNFPAESGYSRAFVMGAVGACVLLVASLLLPREGAATMRSTSEPYTGREVPQAEPLG